MPPARPNDIGRCRMPHKPPIGAAELVEHVGDLQGEIGVGEVFAWEPYLPWARELCVVTRITAPEDNERRIWTRPLAGGEEVWNDEGRFREACRRTTYQRMRLADAR